MEKGTAVKQNILEELHTKWILTDMKHQLLQTACHLIDDEVYTKKHAVHALMEVVALIELEEKKIRPDDVRNQSL
ncbi:hypothetical protein [Lentibacillus sp. CBA3610]|uniref:hypothetical protein n=1 Tax=Lentibacillus sp. CBA3610 TaxID=2518176 RepID=UPI0015956B3C|nr:hypothetical protein [Lentibacillus sp. CBA3610]QKY70289.1 hypothetical protein Len3610_12410 [Lentibacillus sp. CBA3610]